MDTLPMMKAPVAPVTVGGTWALGFTTVPTTSYDEDWTVIAGALATVVPTASPMTAPAAAIRLSLSPLMRPVPPCTTQTSVGTFFPHLQIRRKGPDSSSLSDPSRTARKAGQTGPGPPVP